MGCPAGLPVPEVCEQELSRRHWMEGWPWWRLKKATGCQADPTCSVPTSLPSDQAPTPKLGLRGLSHPMSSSASHLDGELHRVSPPVPWDKPEEGPWARPSVNHFTRLVAFDLHGKPGRRVLILVSLCRAANGGQKDQATCQKSHSNMTAEKVER